MLSAGTLSKSYFKLWLELQPEDRKFSDTIRCKTCPVATFLVEALPYVDVTVGIDEYSVAYPGEDDGFSARYRLPMWAQEFINMYDTSLLGSGTVKEALQVLDCV